MYTANSFGNCATDLKGSGFRPCDIGSYGDLFGMSLLSKGTKIPLNDDAETADVVWKNLIKSLSNFPYLGIYNFEQTTPENERSTSSTGVMASIRNGKPMFSFQFTKGGCFHKSLYNKRGDGRWDIALIFETGVLLAENSDETVSGFNMGMFDVETFRFLQGTDPQSSTAVGQLLNSNQFNANHLFFTWEALGFDFTTITGVVDLNITYPDPVEAGTTFNVAVSSACNIDDIVLGLDDEEMWALGGVQTSATTISGVVYDVDDEVYTFTVSPALIAGDTIAPKLVSTGYNVAEDVAGNLYKGQGAIEIVVA